MSTFNKIFSIITLSNCLLYVIGYGQAQFGRDDFRISNQGSALNGSFVAEQPDIAYNSADSTYLVVWSGVSAIAGFNQKKFEIFGQLLDVEGKKIGSAFQISSTLDDNDLRLDAENPSVAYNSTDNNFLVVWNAPASFFEINSSGVNDQMEIFGQLLAADGSDIGADFRISDTGPPGQVDFDAEAPDVTYNPLLNNYLVVWSGDDARSQNEIYGQFITTNGAETGVNDFRISDMGPGGDANFDAFDPSVCCNLHDSSFLVVWAGDDNTGDLVNEEFEIFGQFITHDGLETGLNDFRISDMGPDGNSSFRANLPEVVFNSIDTSYLVAWRGNDMVGEAFFRQEVYGQLLLGNGQESGPNDFRISNILIEDLHRSLSRPGLIHNHTTNRFQVFYDGVASSNPGDFGIAIELEIFGSEVSSDGETVFSPFQLSAMGPDGDFGFNATLPRAAYDLNNHTALVIWEANDDSPELAESEQEIFGQLIGECVSSITSSELVSPLHSGIFQASQSISFNGMIEAGSEVTFDAGQKTLLEPGFEVQTGTLLNVFNGGCQ